MLTSGAGQPEFARIQEIIPWDGVHAAGWFAKVVS
jgi:hypothetical protein